MSTTSSRFDPRLGAPYGSCINCIHLTFATKAEADAHMHSTLEAAKKAGLSSGHSISVSNPERGSRVRNAVDSIIDDAITDAIEDLIRLTEGRRGEAPDATDDEITEALKWYSDEFSEAWAEYLESEVDE